MKIWVFLVFSLVLAEEANKVIKFDSCGVESPSSVDDCAAEDYSQGKCCFFRVPSANAVCMGVKTEELAFYAGYSKGGMTINCYSNWIQLAASLFLFFFI